MATFATSAGRTWPVSITTADLAELAMTRLDLVGIATGEASPAPLLSAVLVARLLRRLCRPTRYRRRLSFWQAHRLVRRNHEAAVDAIFLALVEYFPGPTTAAASGFYESDQDDPVAAGELTQQEADDLAAGIEPEATTPPELGRSPGDPAGGRRDGETATAYVVRLVAGIAAEIGITTHAHLTWRDLAGYQTDQRTAAWDHTTAVVATLININRKAGSAAIHAEALNPYRQAATVGAPSNVDREARAFVKEGGELCL